MKIAIIGAGFTGLTAAYRLAQQGHKVTVFEKDTKPGGLAIGYQEKNWEWSLEKHYHHWFTNENDAINHDQTIFTLAEDVGIRVLKKEPKTSVYVDGEIFQFDSPKSVLLFPKLSVLERIRMAAVIGAIRYNPFWKPLEKVNASTALPKLMGKKAYEMLWEPQFINKFGSYANDVSLGWFWARLASRTKALAYPEGGYLAFAEALVEQTKRLGGTFHFDTEVVEVSDKEIATVTYKKIKKQTDTFDRIIFTVPSSLFIKTTPQLPDSYKEQFKKLQMIGATNIVLRLKKPFFANDTYWLSVCDTKAPVMAMVEHTNYMDKSHYNNEYLLYLGNYMATDDPRFAMNKEERLKSFDTFLKKFNPEYKKNLIGYELFKAPFAQPIIPANYSRMIPAMKTPLPHVYLANMEQVYPWDRGTSNAVAMGEKVAKLIA